MKLLVEIELENTTVADFMREIGDWRENDRPGYVAVDEAYLPRSRSDNSFFSLKLVGFAE